MGADAVLLAKIKTLDELMTDNHCNAAEIFQYLLDNMGDAFSYPDDDNEDHNLSKKNSVGTKDNPINLDDTPIELVFDVGDDEDDDAFADGSTKEDNPQKTDDGNRTPQSKNSKLPEALSNLEGDSDQLQ